MQGSPGNAKTLFILLKLKKKNFLSITFAILRTKFIMNSRTVLRK